MLLRVKKSQNTSRPETVCLDNNRGQALIEYVLILIITVSLVLALISQIFKPFGQFIDSYMGSYVGCLLEYGELPTLGSSDPAQADEDSECNKKFAEGSLTGGRPPKGAGNSASSADGSVNSKSSNSSSSDSGGGSGGSYAGSNSRGGSRYINPGRRASVGVGEGNAAQGSQKVVEIASDGSGGNSFFGSNRSSRTIVRERKSMAIGIAGLTEAERKKLEKKTSGGGATMVIAEGPAPAPKKTLLKPPEVKAALPEEEPLTVGNFIRYLFIAALVIALVIFIGGQALQMSKSYDK